MLAGLVRDGLTGPAKAPHKILGPLDTKLEVCIFQWVILRGRDHARPLDQIDIFDVVASEAPLRLDPLVEFEL